MVTPQAAIQDEDNLEMLAFDSLVKSALAEFRDIIENANPPILCEFGLQIAIVEYAGCV